MSVELNHIIIAAKDKWVSANFLTHVLGLPAAEPWAHFAQVRMSNGVNLDYVTSSGEVHRTHYAFLVSDEEFDAALGRIQAAGIVYYPDFRHNHPGEINHHYGGRGVYFDDPSGHQLEIITRPYGDPP